MKKTVLLGSLATTVLFGAGFAFGQKQNASSPIMKEFGTATFETMMHSSNTKDAKYVAGPKKLANAYAKVAADPDATRTVMSYSLAELEAINTDNAIQASQRANEVTARMAVLQVAQNARIIELLQQKK